MKVFVVLYSSKHCSAMEGAEAYSTLDKANCAVAAMILEDLGSRYDDAEVVAKLKAAIEAEDWDTMMTVHDAYWIDIDYGDSFAIHACNVG